MAVRQVRMAEVARRAGVSRSAVSAALSTKASTALVSPATRERILAAAKELGYRPNILSRSFIKQQSFLIGMLCREVYFLFVLETIKGIEDVLEKRDYSLLAYYRGSWADDQAKQLRQCADRAVDGLIVVGAPERPDGPNHRTLRQLQEQGVPVVQIYQRIFPGVPAVMVDDAQTGYMAARHLLDLGHRRIVHITHSEYLDLKLPGTHRNARDRWEGYRRAMLEAGLEPAVLTFERTGNYGLGANDYSGYVRNVARQLAETRAYSAATTFNDYTIIGLVQHLARLGVRVPEDLSLVGYDDVEAGALMRPALTTLRPPLAQIGRAAAQLVLDMIDGKPGQDLVFNPQLVVRESTAMRE